MSNRIRTLLVALAAMTLAACQDASFVDDGTGTTPGGSNTPASLTLITSATQLSSNASTAAQGVTLTAIVKDGSNNVLPDQLVSFSSDSGTLGAVNATTGFVTDDNGQVQAFLHTAGDARNRVITVTAATGAVSRQISILVTGTTLAVNGPSATQINVPTDYVIQLADGGGVGISNQAVTVTTNSGNAITASSLTTDTAGQVTVQLTATVADTTITATALNLTAIKSVVVSTDQFEFVAPAVSTEEPIPELPLGTAQTISVRWLQSGSPVPAGTIVNFSATRGTLSASSDATDASGIATVTVSSDFSGFSQLKASSNALTTPTATRVVEFVADSPSTIDLQATPATIGTGQTSEIRAIVRDAAQNLVKNQIVEFVVFQDPSNGTVDNATVETDSLGTAKTIYRATSATSGFNGVGIRATVQGTGVTDTTALTVGSRAARIVVGTGSIILIKDESTYQLPFTVVVTDQAGNPTPDANVTLSVLPHQFIKGTFAFTAAVCANEDIDFDTINDPTEDVDADGILEPGNVASAPVTLELDDDGSGQFLVTYPKDIGFFVVVDVIARVIVEGTETTAVRRILLTIAEADEDNLPGVSPYGTDASCASPD